MSRYKFLENFTFQNCVIRSREIFYFPAQKIEYSDPLESWLTAFFVYYPLKEPSKRWAFRSYCHTGDVFGARAVVPDERGVFVNCDGECYVVGGGQDGWEEPILDSDHLEYVYAVATIGGKAGALLADGVYARHNVDSWARVNAAPIDGASYFAFGGDDSRLVVVGENGKSVGIFNGETTALTEPTTDDFRHLCTDGSNFCAIDNRGQVFNLREGSWQAGPNLPASGPLVFYGEEFYALVNETIYSVSTGNPANLGEPAMKTKAYIDSYGGVLLLAGQQEFAFLDGEDWHQPLKAPSEELLWF